jgi:hypothetical protein
MCWCQIRFALDRLRRRRRIARRLAEPRRRCGCSDQPRWRDAGATAQASVFVACYSHTQRRAVPSRSSTVTPPACSGHAYQMRAAPSRSPSRKASARIYFVLSRPSLAEICCLKIVFLTPEYTQQSYEPWTTRCYKIVLATDLNTLLD